MKRVGFDGGSFVCELGPSSDVAAFFACVEAFATESCRQLRVALITDRLYQRYLRREDLHDASETMTCIRRVFSEVPSARVDWRLLSRDPLNSSLDVSKPDLGQVFSSYFESFNRCVESALLFYDSWGAYQPVRTVITDMPDYMIDKKRELSEYEGALQEPFWRRV